MALSNPLEQYAEDNTLCPVCKEDFVDPRSPCLHTFCLKCLKGFCGDRGPGEEVKCPFCREEFVIPHNGVDGLPRYFTNRDLVRARKKQLVYTRTMKQVDKTQQFEIRKQLKQLVYSRKQRQVNQTELIRCELKQLIYSRQNTQDHMTILSDVPICSISQFLLRTHHTTTMHSLPYELHEMLLKRSCCLFAKTLLKADARPDIQLFITLSSVCRYFHFILTVRRRRSVRTFTKQQLTVMYRLRQVHPLLLATIGDQRQPVIGLCTMNNQLYVNYWQSPTINVYTSHQPYTLLRHIQTPLGVITDMSSCSINNCLYVAGPDTERCCYAVDRITTDDKVVQWLQYVGVVRRLSVTSDGRVVMLIMNYAQGCGCNITYRCKVEVYNSTGVKLTKLNLPLDIVNPSHVVQTANKSFIVSHGDYNTELHRVCEVNNKGFIVTSHGGTRGSGLGQLNTPFDIALDSEERVLVADSFNRRVLLLDIQQNTQRVLLEWSRVSPYRLFYETSERRLFVACHTGQIAIYSL